MNGKIHVSNYSFNFNLLYIFELKKLIVAKYTT